MKRTEPVIFHLKLTVLALMASLVLPSHLVAQSAEETKLIARAEQAITEAILRCRPNSFRFPQMARLVKDRSISAARSSCVWIIQTLKPYPS